MNEAEQFGRFCRLTVFGSNLQGLDLSQLRIKFAVKRSDTVTPNMADIRVYNLALETALTIQKEFTQVLLEAGYEGNSGIVFQGNIKQILLGRESATDTYIDIIAGDGDRAYNYSVINTTLAAGANQEDQVRASISTMTPKGVSAGFLGEFPPERLPRGKVLFGNSREILRNVAQTTNKSWSIQDEKVNFVSNTSYLPGERVVLTSKTGMIGTPQQTTEGVNVKCLLNPKIKIGGLIQIDNASVEKLKINLSVVASAANTPASLTADGVYYILVAEYTGDTRGVDWYTTMIGINVDLSSNPRNSIGAN